MGTKFYLLLLVIIVLAGCKQSQQKIVYEKDSVKLAQDFLPGVAGSPSPETPSLKERLQGAWTDGSDVNANFLIEKDSIIFIEQGPHKYELKNDSIKIFFEDSTTRSKIFFKKDTLIMDSGGQYEAVKYWRFKG